MHRFFVSSEVLARDPVTLTGAQAHQIRRVLRLRLGDRITLLDNRGWAHEGILITLADDEARFQIVRRWEAGGEPRVRVVLYQAVIKGERFEWLLQKGTELGVSRFVPTICERNVVADMVAIEDRRQRWERIIQEAAEQSGRSRKPELAAAELFQSAMQPIQRTPEAANILRLIAWEGERVATVRGLIGDRNLLPGARIDIFVGPEGGFTPPEVQLAQQHGLHPVTLGPRTLRAETAGIVASTIVLYEAGDL